MKKCDFVEGVASIAVQTGLSVEQVAQFADAIRKEYGGKTVTIDRRPPVTIDDVNNALRHQKSVRVISKETGLSRSTIYRMLSSRKSRMTSA